MHFTAIMSDHIVLGLTNVTHRVMSIVTDVTPKLLTVPAWFVHVTLNIEESTDGAICVF